MDAAGASPTASPLIFRAATLLLLFCCSLLLNGQTQPEDKTAAAQQLFLIADMVLLSVVDLETWLIPYETTMPGLVLGFILAPIFPALHQSASLWTGSPWLEDAADQGVSTGKPARR